MTDWTKDPELVRGMRVIARAGRNMQRSGRVAERDAEDSPDRQKNQNYQYQANWGNSMGYHKSEAEAIEFAAARHGYVDILDRDGNLVRRIIS